MITDLALWEAIRQDDEQAFAKLFYRYSPRIYSNAYLHLKDREACKQITHDVFLTLWRNRKVLEIKAFKAYLTAAARYQVYKHLASSRINPIAYKEDLIGYHSLSTENTGYHQLACQDLERQVEGCLTGLPKRCQEVYVMSRQQLLSNDEIASKLNISKKTVENQINQALKHLRLNLTEDALLLTVLGGCLMLWQP